MGVALSARGAAPYLLGAFPFAFFFGFSGGLTMGSTGNSGSDLAHQIGRNLSSPIPDDTTFHAMLLDGAGEVTATLKHFHSYRTP
jgi:hypothetical protein